MEGITNKFDNVMKEIEKKYKVKNLPDLSLCEKIEISQGYLNVSSEPTLRIRKYNDDYFLTYKYTEDDDKKSACNVCTEYELPITKDAFHHLKEKIDGKMIIKTRYLIPIENDFTVELDVFKEDLDGLVIAEIEFEEEINFKKPDWLGIEVTKDKRYRNSYLALGNVNIDDIK